MARESFEVYYYQESRWQLHASFEPAEREKAIEEAKGIEAKEGFPSRVVRESFSEESNTSEETVTWQSAKAKNIHDTDTMFGEKKAAKGKDKKKKPPPPAPARPRPAPEQPRSEPKSEPSKPKPARPAAKAASKKTKGKKKRSGLVRFLIAILISLALAIVSLVATSLIVAQAASMGILPPRNYSQLILGASVLVFFAAVFINLQRQFNILSFLRGEKKSKQGMPPGAQDMLAAAKKRPVQDIEFDQVEIEDLRAKVEAEDAALEEEAVEAEVEAELPDLGADMDMGAEVHGSEPPPEAAPEPAPAPVAAPEVKAASPAPKVEEKKPAPPKAPEKTPAEAEARTNYSKFISDVMRLAKPEPTNAFSKFGMNLYFAGSASVIGQSKRLPKDVQLSVLKDGLVSAGNTAERAENFCVELPTYGKNPKYTVMVQAGAKAMTQFMGGSANATAEIGALLQEWNLPEKRPTVPSVFTFVFTEFKVV